MKYREWRIEEGASGWCKIFKANVPQARAINVSEARRYVWLKLKKKQRRRIKYITPEMMSA